MKIISCTGVIGQRDLPDVLLAGNDKQYIITNKGMWAASRTEHTFLLNTFPTLIH